jgi:hypothetical protein
VELTPDREYLLVTEFFDGATELGEAEVSDEVIDDGLGIVRKLWDAGFAHRDVKPANLLVRDGKVLLIDVAFVEARPSPWRQAVDLANMMLCLALRSDPEVVYQRPCASSRPRRSARRSRPHPRPDHAVAASPPAAGQGPGPARRVPGPAAKRPRSVSIQRWSARRVGLAVLVVLGLALALPLAVNWGVRTDRIGTSLYLGNLDCTRREPQWLMAQSVPSASLVPRAQLLPVGWTLADVRVEDGRARITFDHDRAGTGAVVVQLAASCDPSGAVASQQPGARRYQRVERLTGGFTAIYYDRFPGGCVTSRMHSTTDTNGAFASEAPRLLGFTTRTELGQALSQRSGGRLKLDVTAR